MKSLPIIKNYIQLHPAESNANYSDKQRHGKKLYNNI